jgi:hypothetical protein
MAPLSSASSMRSAALGGPVRTQSGGIRHRTARAELPWCARSFFRVAFANLYDWGGSRWQGTAVPAPRRTHLPATRGSMVTDGG